ncbi:MAG TPA: zonular occludens toxin domain-containing protein [Ureibacillus sp.]|nr:zonular occludens toxin domain-containing protein [Ureibacillus sp.]
MTIELYTGFVGSGKSYAAVKNGTMIADAPMGKRWVIANFPIKPKKTMFSRFRKKKFIDPRWIHKRNNELTPDFLIKESLDRGWNKKEGSCLVIFDEAGIPFNSRSWNSPDRMQWIDFLSQSRKFGYDFIFITQHRDMMDKQIRKLCEYEVQHKRLNNMFAFKLLNLFRVTLFGGVSFWNGMRNERGTLRLYFYRKKIADRYDTLKLFGVEEKANDEKNNSK